MRSGFVRIIFALALIALMATVAYTTGVREVIVPEVAALAMGFWVLDKQIWRIGRWQTVVLLTVIALFAVLLNRLFQMSFTVRMSIMFLFISSMLMLTKASLSPAFAVGLLAVMFDDRSLVYPLSVLILSLILVVGQNFMDVSGLRSHENLHHPMRSTWGNPWRWLWLLVAALPLIILADITDYRLCVAPPFIVSFVELSNSKAGFRFRLVQICAMLIIASAIGTLCKVVLADRCGIVEPVAMTTAVALVFTMFGVFGKRFAPAAPTAILPFVIPSISRAGFDNIMLFPAFSAIGVTYFIVIAHLFFIRQDYSFE